MLPSTFLQRHEAQIGSDLMGVLEAACFVDHRDEDGRNDDIHAGHRHEKPDLRIVFHDGLKVPFRLCELQVDFLDDTRERLDELPLVDRPRDDGAEVNVRVNLPRVVAQYGNVSMSAARRLIDEGAVSINGKPCKDNAVDVSADDVIKIGRHTFIKVVGPGV